MASLGRGLHHLRLSSYSLDEPRDKYPQRFKYFMISPRNSMARSSSGIRLDRVLVTVTLLWSKEFRLDNIMSLLQAYPCSRNVLSRRLNKKLTP